MNLNLTVLAQDAKSEFGWMRELQDALAGLSEVKLAFSTDRRNPGDITFIDARLSDLDEVLAGLDREGRAVFLVVEEGAPVPEALSDGRVDDVLVHPFRSLEALGKLRHYQQILMWDEV